MSRRDPLLAVLGVLALIQAAALSVRLVRPDLGLDYPFMDGDSHDWIANGLFLVGEDVRYSGRAPLLPLVIALLDRIGALSWLPVLLVALFHGTVLAFYTLAARLTSRGAAFAASLTLMLCHSLLGLSLQIMADVPASCLLFLGARAFLLERYQTAGLLIGLSAVTQPIGLLGLLLFLWRRRSWTGAALLLAFPLLWAVLRPAGEADIAARQWDLVSFHLGSVPFYGLAWLSLLGLPACIALVAGLFLNRNLFVVTLFAVLTGFFVFFYTWEAQRFLVYPVWMAGLLIATALARLPRMALAVAAVLVVGGAALPPAGEPFQIQRAWERRAAVEHLDPELVRQDRSALYVYDKRPDRYRMITQTGNALRKRVKVVPRTWLEPWWGWTRMERLGKIGEDGVYRVWLPGREESWLVVGPLTPGPSPIRSLPPGEGGRLADRIVAELDGWDGYVALVPGERHPWQLYVPFLVETTELYVPEPDQEAEILRIFEKSLAEKRIGPVTVRRAEILGRKASLVRGTAAPPR